MDGDCILLSVLAYTPDLLPWRALLGFCPLADSHPVLNYQGYALSILSCNAWVSHRVDEGG
jgi:hypothetical protein